MVRPRMAGASMASDTEWPTCQVAGCGRDIDFDDCWQCGGEGHGDDLHDLDPLWYDPGTFPRCEECGGRGTISHCENHGRIIPELEPANA